LADYINIYLHLNFHEDICSTFDVISKRN